VAVAVAAVPPFYANATVVLVAMLITWLVAEGPKFRKDLTKTRTGDPRAAPARYLPKGWMLTVAIAIVAGIVSSLWVQFQEHASWWEPIVVWMALGLGLVAATFSLVLNVYERDELNNALLQTLRVAKRRGAFAVAVVFGVLASPLFHKQPVRYVGAKFAVSGTCLSGGCGLKQRIGPGPGFREVKPHKRLPDGTLVLVMCQTSGPSPQGKPRYTSRVWDHLDNGNYVSDAFVDTPNRSGFSSGLPRCGRGNRRGTAG
jgi:hypothetical protein